MQQSFLFPWMQWISISADFIGAGCLYRGSFTSETFAKSSNEWRYFFYKKKKNICSAKCKYGKCSGTEIYVCQ